MAAVIVLAGGHWAPSTSFALLLGIMGTTGLVIARIHSGLAPLDRIRNLVDEALAEAIGTPNQRDITFKQLTDHGKLPLKLVATNLSDQSLALFCHETTPGVAVADAVAASICLPFIFRIWRFHSMAHGQAAMRSYLDGGVMSNLPVWPFDEERLLDPGAATIAFGLEPPAARDAHSRHWLLAAINTVVAGPPELHMRGVNRLVHIRLPSALHLLDFDAGFARFSENIELARQTASYRLALEMTEIPRRMRALLEKTLEHVAARIAPAPLNRDWELRIALAIQKPTSKMTLTIAYEVGHTGQPSSFHLALQSGVGLAWQERAAKDTNMEIFRDDAASNDRLYPDSKWMILLPVEAMTDAGGVHDEVDANLAVVAIIDSPIELDKALISNEIQLRMLADGIHRSALNFISRNDLGNLARRAFSWL
ncbi:patatin-like phospholipase family protein [Bordetella genomosp. 13]|uniref:patatin-like phospholipase family protein n=1 Tax=Bordetella genomosp. 13 TaxID=463040 RepID=UPI0016425F83|nr:patatin-like phospholipase family protein [Bordetella genomosp. 13]